MRSRAGVVVAALLCSCAPQPRWDAAARRLRIGELSYRVGPLGPAWRLVHVEKAELTFHDQAAGGVVTANATCRDDAEGASLEALTERLLVGWTDRRDLGRELVTLDGRAALHTVVAARLDGVPMVLDLYVLKRNGCVFDLSYVAAPDRRAVGADDFARFVAGFLDERRA